MPLIAQFRREYVLVGGTAIALQMGHRRSVDFDMFKYSALNHKRNLDKIVGSGFKANVTRRVSEQMNLIVNGVKITFFQYPFQIYADVKLADAFRMPSLMTLAAMKAYALGRRSKWKDYVDLHLLLTSRFSVEEISAKASEIVVGLLADALGVDEVTAMNKYFASSAYAAISDEAQKLWRHSPQLLAAVDEFIERQKRETKTR